jgi:NADP-dependent 3-hydroxy-3-methylglutaryl-CoA reductase
MSIGIEYIDLYTNLNYIDLHDLAVYLGVDPNKYKYGIGQDKMSYCGDNEDIISMYLTLVEQIMTKYSYNDIGYIQIGTETIIDKSKSIKTHIMELFNEYGNNSIYGLDTYNACYGGTASLFHGLNWLESSMFTPNKPYALILCGDIAVYKNDNEKCTGGSGVIGMILSKKPKIIIDPKSICMDFKNRWDFYKPLKEKEYPIVNGQLSIQCYIDGLINCYKKYTETYSSILDNSLTSILFHQPYNKLVKKGLKELLKFHENELYNEDVSVLFETIYTKKTEPSTYLSKIIGNIYSGSLYLGLISLLYYIHKFNSNDLTNKTIMLYSFGSGYTASLFNMTILNTDGLIDITKIDELLINRKKTSISTYLKCLKNREHTYDLSNTFPIDKNNNVNPNTYILDKIENGIRYYIKAHQYKVRDDSLINSVYTRQSDLNINISYKEYDYSNVVNRCCENVIGYIKVPLGYVGPIIVNNKSYTVPLSTVEGALIASVNRGCKAIRESNGVTSICINKGMSRAPLFECDTLETTFELYNFLQRPETLNEFKKIVNNVSSHSFFLNSDPKLVDNKIYLRIVCDTSDAMGMNMLTKCSNEIVKYVINTFHKKINCVCLSSNYCTDKKNSAVNWVNGRGKHVITELIISEETINKVLKTTSNKLIKVNIDKNLIGSNVAGTIGGMNAHAANMIGAIFLATGQDIAQIVNSSMCLTNIEKYSTHDFNGIRISVTLPSLECGIVGGGTHLESQSTVLKYIGVQSSIEFAELIGAIVLAGELSLISSLSVNTLVESHGTLNAYKTN